MSTEDKIESLERAVNALTERMDQLFDFLGEEEDEPPPSSDRYLLNVYRRLMDILTADRKFEIQRDKSGRIEGCAVSINDDPRP